MSFVWKYLIKSCKFGLYFLASAFIIVVAGGIFYLNNQPDLDVWHKVKFDSIFSTDSGVTSFEQYIALENELFRELDDKITKHISPSEKQSISRFRSGSMSDPNLISPNWNRSFELKNADPKCGVLLLHGMSDSPYSLRNIGEALNEKGAYVVGLRLPGHGVAPSGLLSITWQDMAAAVNIGMQYLQSVAKGKPLYIIGYSNGGALGINYAFDTLNEPVLPNLSGLVLISPAMGVTPFAVMAKWQAALGELMGLEKLAWSSVKPEYDPYKYSSFAVNAGAQTHALTMVLLEKRSARKADGTFKDFPPVLAFQSIVDTTVSTRDLVHELFLHLPKNDHDLVLFDINRDAEGSQLLNSPLIEYLDVLRDEQLPFALSIITNRRSSGEDVSLFRKYPDGRISETTDISMSWPFGIHSLSHISLPFPETDPVYGRLGDPNSPSIHLGRLEMRGESGVMRISSDDMLRLRSNPFYPYLEERILEFIR